ncbi:rhodanese-like domain-containing protein [Bacillus sp. USDA818B3_A]|uniref:rhodanese-like domain-containing protein n=1 Tax=Bacillus sp. USDA818B3_A TaxID=2698834 RepID=UPI0013697AB9|nr:rhodanese-like domain-containing protein [Bacillus sp. USDA818B3_A]
MTIKTITPKELEARLKGNGQTYILDVRAEDKYNDFHIEAPKIKSFNIPKTTIFELEEKRVEEVASLPKNHEIVVTCTTGNSAKKCATILSEKNYNVTLLEGGITAWKEYLHTQKRN